MELRDYQRDSVEAVWAHLRERGDNPVVVLPTGCGKAVIIAELCRQAVMNWGGRVLVLTHVRELVAQGAEKLRMLLPPAMVGVHSAGLRQRDLNHPVICGGIQSLYRRACDLGAFNLILVDECFPAGTRIDTPRGDIPIEDLYVGQPVRHALGVGNIEAISARPTHELVRLELSDGSTVECTPNHRFFTESGWREAGALAVGTRLFGREDVSRLRKGIFSECMEGRQREAGSLPIGNGMDGPDLLLAGMPSNIPTETPEASPVLGDGGSGGPSPDMAPKGADGDQGMPVLWPGLPAPFLRTEADAGKGVETSAVLFDLLREEGRKPDVHSVDRGKNVREAQGDRTPAHGARREWRGVDVAAGDAGPSPGRGNGILGGDDGPATQGGGGPRLQTGRGDSVYPSRDSAGREQSRREEGPVNGSERPEMAGGIRVVRIVPVQLESPRVVYNLQVAGHPSYYADGVLVHNCHLIPADGEGMYRTFLKDARIINPAARLCGLTATPFRLSSGSICSKDGLLNEVCYEAGIKEMIEARWLSPLISRCGRRNADASGLHLRGGEFIPGEIEALMDADALVRSAVAEVVEATADRRSCLLFCAGVRHAEHVVRVFREDHGLECGFVEGNTPSAERARLIARFKGEQTDTGLFGQPEKRLKYLANVSVLGIGFDAPHIDCVVLLRPTMSPGLLVQQVGRGFRLAPGKDNCLILDFAGNLVRHGPVDMLKAGDRPKNKGTGEPPHRECPECHRVCHASVAVCPECGFEFPKNDKPKHDAHASTAPVVSDDVPVEPREFEVLETIWSVHHKKNAPPGHPPSLRVSYRVGGYTDWFSEWVCPQHSGYARDKFVQWWGKRSHYPAPRTVDDAIRMAQEGCLAKTLGIRVAPDANGYDKIVAWSLDAIPDVDTGLMEAIRETPAGEPWPVGVAVPAGDAAFDDDFDDIPF